MKPSAEDWESEALDKLLFDYLEGNLPDGQALALEKKAAADALLGSELEYWKETKLTGDFYDTSLLEKKLLMAETMPAGRAEKAGSGAKPVSGYLFVLLLSLCSLWPVKLEKEAARLENAPGYQMLAEEKAGATRAFPAPVPAKEIPQKPAVMQKRAQPVATFRPDRLVISQVNPLTPPVLRVSRQIRELTLTEAASKKMALKKIPLARTISRRQARQIARMKEKALQRRMANEFLKGRIPYVVPLNTRNF
jgi:hypothetical protein